MQFHKMHGAGNDYVLINLFTQSLPIPAADLARMVSCRRRGIGSDGLILVGPSSRAAARMQIWNPDGSEAEMCGNGLRCVARMLFDHHHVRQREFTIETGRGCLSVRLSVFAGEVQSVTVNMGTPLFESAEIPTRLEGSPLPVTVLRLEGRDFPAAAVGMGNPHLVVFVEELDSVPTSQWGPQLEHHAMFPRRTNVEFIQVCSPTRIRVRVWERGAGETLACGTGACAAAVASQLLRGADHHLTCEMPGGDLEIAWEPDGNVFLTGPAEFVFSGTWAGRDTVLLRAA